MLLWYGYLSPFHFSPYTFIIYVFNPIFLYFYLFSFSCLIICIHFNFTLIVLFCFNLFNFNLVICCFFKILSYLLQYKIFYPFFFITTMTIVIIKFC
jgi:hypothetical protein